MNRRTVSTAALAGLAMIAAQPATAKSKCAKLTPQQIDAQFASFNDAWATKD